MARFGQISSKESTGPGAGKERPKGPLRCQISSNYVKSAGERKTPETVEFPGFFGILKSRSALAELRSTSSCFEAVLG